MFKTPILFIIFNRPDTAQLVFNQIKKIKPQNLYVAIDGPRPGNIEDVNSIQKGLDMLEGVNWPCQLKILRRNTNLGCKFAVSEAINWLFETEDEGIILEDDILPVNSFFQFCEEMLERYRNDSRVGSISGCNPVSGYFPMMESYDFSIYNYIWGWATWKRAWNTYDVMMKDLPEWLDSGGLKEMSNGDKVFERYWKEVFLATYLGEVDTWDAQWAYACWRNSFLCVLPRNNQISNLGFNNFATHTKGGLPKYLEKSKPHEMVFPTKFSGTVTPNRRLDKLIFVKAFKPKVLNRMLKKLKFLKKYLIKSFP